MHGVKPAGGLRARITRLFFAVSLLCPAFLGAQAEDLRVLQDWRLYSPAGDLFYRSLAREALGLLAARDRELAGLHGRTQWERYAASVRARLAASFGPLWEKTPLNARTVGAFEHAGLQVEKIIFESRPGWQVTAAVVRQPGLEGRLPAVLLVCGHTNDGLRGYQQQIFNLARRGFVVLCFDPIGQGERYQYYDPELGRSRLGGTTHEHSYAGLQYLLLGRTMGAVRLWDGIRAVDYLLSRPDVDPARIAVHGRSGGGTMSSYLGAMEPRISVAAPECYLTSFRRLFESIGPQDAEQNLLGQIAAGLDHGDFLIARAPKPSLMLTTTRDMFSIAGARATFASVRPAFDALGAPGNLQMVEDDAPHQSTVANRERLYGFLRRQFGTPGDTVDVTFPVVPPDSFKISDTGQVITSGSRTIHELILEDAAPVLAQLEQNRKDIKANRERVSRAARSLAGLGGPVPAGPALFCGRFTRRACYVEKLVLDSESPLPLPALVFVPKGAGPHPAILWLDDRGKAAAGVAGGEPERLAEAGWLVLSLDLPGFGELAADPHADDSVIQGVSYNLLFGAQLVGRSVTGIQARAAEAALLYLQGRPDAAAAGGSVVVAAGAAGPAALHAAALGAPVRALCLGRSLLSWESVLETRWYDQALGATIVPSALLQYDLPDLAGLFAPRPLLVAGPLGGDGAPADSALREGFAATVATVAGGDNGLSFAADSSGLAPWLAGLAHPAVK
ncbi:acetylxylan esterase [bacterium]|nr:acetylxylan esterase [bacterium]